MRRIHIGHHFFGAGNTGDDLMLAGFLTSLRDEKPVRQAQGRPEARDQKPVTFARSVGGRGEAAEFKLTCCTPFDREVLSVRFPEVEWLPYETSARRKAIGDCDLWLGLGGSPWQNAVSRWFIDHLEQERKWCAEMGKPMRFLGVGGQDAAAYELPETRALCEQAEGIWTRDAATAEALARIVSVSRVHQGADLAHAWLEKNPPRPAKEGRLVAVLNFDFSDWKGMAPAMGAIDFLPARERIWLVQESRELPGAELLLHAQLSERERARWSIYRAERPSINQATAEWPCGEWQLGSRFHATIVAAWAGSKAVVLGTNEKLRGIAADLGYPTLSPHAEMGGLANLMQGGLPPERARLVKLAVLARDACAECLA